MKNTILSFGKTSYCTTNLRINITSYSSDVRPCRFFSITKYAKAFGNKVVHSVSIITERTLVVNECSIGYLLTESCFKMVVEWWDERSFEQISSR